MPSCRRYNAVDVALNAFIGHFRVFLVTSKSLFEMLLQLIHTTVRAIILRCTMIFAT